MDSEIVDAVTDWDSTPFSGGYEGLRELADGEFSGVITEGTAWAFMLNGRVVGIEDGSMSSFEKADGTSYIAPTPALPLLYVMQTRGEEQTKYYTNEKSISEADSTLSSGGFTGYIELSENVLSGDYYTLYYGGKSMSVAFIGNSRKLLTDDEAFERADDEIGIYTVYAADPDVVEIPDPPGASEASDQPAEASTPTETADETATDTPSADTDTTASGSTSTQPDSQSNTVDERGEQTAETRSANEPSAAGASSDSSPASTARSQSSTASNSDPTATSQSDTQPAATTTDSETSDRRTQANASTASTGGRQKTTDAAGSSNSSTASSEGVFNDEAEWRNSKTIPSLDPSDDPKRTENNSRSQQSNAQSSSQGSSVSSLSRPQLEKGLKRAEQIIQKAESEHEQLIEERDALESERDAAQQELETVRAKLSEAEAEIERLKSQLQSDSTPGSTAGNGAVSGGQSMSTADALDGTNLLVRYASKGDGTLEDAISGSVDQATITSNLRIEPHTTFDSEQVSVDGQPFETFLDGRIELAFVRWLTEEFLFDIQQTGNETELSGIYETLPAINRAELQGTVSLGTDDEGDELTATFDLVVRDKRDRPLFIADFNESKQPVGSGMINSLVRDGGEIIQQNESFAAAFAVTTSYYEGAALDSAADATGGGLLSASRGKSFVYSSRKQGFHLCLVERLGETFDLHVPEL